MTALRAGVAGVGRLGREHSRLLAGMEGVELAGLHDIDAERGRAVAEEFDSRHEDRLEGLLDRVDALVVAVPTRDHHQVADAALRAGCHVLVEKPMTATLDEADALIELAGREDLRLCVGHVERFNPAVRSCRPYLEEPRFVESLRLAPFQPRGTDVTVILDLMIHDIDLVLGLVESPLASLHAVGTPVLTDSVDIANARLVFENGTVAEITASRVSEEQTRMLRLFQSSGYIRLDLARGAGEFLRRRPDAGADGEPPSSLRDLVERKRLEGDEVEPLLLELRAFVDAIEGDDSDIVSGEGGRAALDVAFRITQEIEHFQDVPLGRP